MDPIVKNAAIELFENLSHDENELIHHAYESYGNIYIIAAESIGLLLDCMESMDPKAFLFAQFLSQARASLSLALLSCLRRHECQTHLMLRQAIESSVLAGYGLFKPDFAEFGTIEADKTIKINNRLKDRAYRWINKEFPSHSAGIKTVKERINSYFAHPNFLNSSSTFEITEVLSRSHYFDKESKFHITAQLWLIADTTLGMMLFFTDLHKKYPLIHFISQFDDRGNKLLNEIRVFYDDFKKIAKSKINRHLMDSRFTT